MSGARIPRKKLSIPSYQRDFFGQVLDTSKFNYTLTFEPGQLPPVKAFWSVTMYDGKTRFLVENPLNRYLINSIMLPELKNGVDGSITLYLQHKSSGGDLESNWLPRGPIALVMRLHVPRPEVLNEAGRHPRSARQALCDQSPKLSFRSENLVLRHPSPTAWSSAYARRDAAAGPTTS